MSATIYVCPQCHAHYIGNGHTRYCAACGAALDNLGPREGGFGLQDAVRLIADGWQVFVGREGVKG